MIATISMVESFRSIISNFDLSTMDFDDKYAYLN